MDVSVTIASDFKFRRIARGEHPERYPIALAAYVGLLGQCWQEERRVPLVEGWPVLLDWDAAVAAEMAAVGLIDDAGCIPERTWAEWFEPARERRDRARERARQSYTGARRLREDSAQTTRSLQGPIRPTDPSDRSEPSVVRPVDEDDEGAPEGWDRAWTSFLREWRRRYGALPSEKQRATLWELVDARPADAGRWLADAPKDAAPYEAVAHVLRRWRALRNREDAA